MTEKYPFDQTFQLKTLSLMARDHTFMTFYGDVLSPSYFSNDLHGSFARLLTDYFTKYKACPTLDTARDLIAHYAKKHGLDMSSLSELEALVDKVYQIELTDAQYVTDSAVSFGQHQAMKLAILDSAKALQDDTAIPEQRMAKIRSYIDSAMRVGMGITDHGMEVYGSLSDLPKMSKTSDMYSRKVKTGWPTFDSATYGGVGAGEIAVVCGGTGQGKSTLLVNLAAIATEQAVPVVYITHELSELDVVLRLAARLTGIPVDRITDSVTPDYELAVDKLTKYKKYLRVKYMHPGRTSPSTIRSYLSKVESVYGVRVGLLINDYADKLVPSSRAHGNAYADLGSIYDELSVLAKDFRLPIWTASQLHRGGLYGEAAGADNVADSFMKIMNCDIAMIIQQTREQKMQGKMRGWLDKVRRGRDQIGVNMFVDYERMLVMEVQANQPTL